jgi:hypothetical protein
MHAKHLDDNEAAHVVVNFDNNIHLIEDIEKISDLQDKSSDFVVRISESDIIEDSMDEYSHQKALPKMTINKNDKNQLGI